MGFTTRAFASLLLALLLTPAPALAAPFSFDAGGAVQFLANNAETIVLGLVAVGLILTGVGAVAGIGILGTIGAGALLASSAVAIGGVAAKAALGAPLTAGDAAVVGLSLIPGVAAIRSLGIGAKVLGAGAKLTPLSRAGAVGNAITKLGSKISADLGRIGKALSFTRHPPPPHPYFNKVHWHNPIYDATVRKAGQAMMGFGRKLLGNVKKGETPSKFAIATAQFAVRVGGRSARAAIAAGFKRVGNFIVHGINRITVGISTAIGGAAAAYAAYSRARSSYLSSSNYSSSPTNSTRRSNYNTRSSSTSSGIRNCSGGSRGGRGR